MKQIYAGDNLLNKENNLKTRILLRQIYLIQKKGI